MGGTLALSVVMDSLKQQMINVAEVEQQRRALAVQYEDEQRKKLEAEQAELSTRNTDPEAS